MGNHDINLDDLTNPEFANEQEMARASRILKRYTDVARYLLSETKGHKGKEEAVMHILELASLIIRNGPGEVASFLSAVTVALEATDHGEAAFAVQALSRGFQTTSNLYGNSVGSIALPDDQPPETTGDDHDA